MSERAAASPARSSSRRERSQRVAADGTSQPPRRARSRSAETRAALNAAIAAAQKELDASLAQRVLSSLTCGAPRRQLVDEYSESGAILGRGAFSFVLSVERRSSGKPFAAKCVHSQGMARAERREALRSALAEAVTLAKLRHPGVVALYDLVLERKRACLLLERCEGGTLLTLVQGRVNESKARIARERRAAGSTGVAGSGAGLAVVANLFGAPREPPPPYCLSEAEARAGLRAATEALRYVHDHGFVHRDVKLENLLMATPLDLSTLKLADFGFATTTARPSSAPRATDKGLQGTVEYAAPEILAAYRGQKAKNGASPAEAEAAARPAVDMWSLGVTLFLMLGGYHLFDTSRESEVVRRAPGPRLDTEFQRTPWAGVSGPARQLVRQLLAAPPGERLSAPAVLAHAWLQAGPEQAIVRAPVVPPSPPAPTPSTRRARGTGAPAGAALPRREATYGVPTPPHKERSAAARAAASPQRAAK